MSSNVSNLLFALLAIGAFAFGCSSRRGLPGNTKAEWTRSQKLAGKDKGLSHVSGLAVSGDTVFATVGGTVADQNEGNSGLRRISVAGGTVDKLDSGARLPQAEQGGIAIDDKCVYWNAGGSIFRIPLGGGTAETIVSENVGVGIDMALDKEKVYWANHGYYSPGEPAKASPLYSAAKVGGPAEVFAGPQLVPGNVVIDDEYVYWTTPSSIVKRSRSGGDAKTVFQASDGEGVDGLQADAGSLYFGLRGAGRSRWSLQKIAKSGGSHQLIAKTLSLKQFVIDDSDVYFFDEADMSSDALCRVPKTGGDVVVLDTGYAGGAMAQNKTHIFFSSLDDIYSIAK